MIFQGGVISGTHALVPDGHGHSSPHGSLSAWDNEKATTTHDPPSPGQYFHPSHEIYYQQQSLSGYPLHELTVLSPPDTGDNHPPPPSYDEAVKQ